MGAAGLTSSTVEMADKGGVGIELNLEAIPTREDGMTAYEIMLSESQERMLMVLKPGREDEARAVFDKWELDFAIIGRVTDSGHFILKWNGELVADIPVAPLVNEAPLYDRPWEPAPARAVLPSDAVASPDDPLAVLRDLLHSANFCSRRWIWEQYDHMVMADTNQRPGGDAAIIRIHDTTRGLAITTDCTPRYCHADPETGGMQAVAEAWRNLCAVGARPLALTNNLNFGNPERPSIMGQFVGCVAGIGAASKAFDFPVVSGNVSLYNETNGEAILPTPVIGGLGLVDDLDRTARVAFAAPDQAIVLIGETTGWLGASAYLAEIEGRTEGAPPPVDLLAERAHGEFVRERINAGAVTACHDVSDGGLIVAVAEMAMAASMGARLDSPNGDLSLVAWLFGEDQARYIVTVSDPESFIASARAAAVPAMVIGRTGGESLTVDGAYTISVSELRAAHETWLPTYMAAT